MYFHPLKKKIDFFFLNNVKFGHETYFNMENTFNSQIGILNLKMENTTRKIKRFCISRLTVTYLFVYMHTRSCTHALLHLEASDGVFIF
jgi:hypothetical protein